MGLGTIQVPSESINFLFHLGMLGALAYALEVGLDLALELEADAARAALEGVLYDIAAELLLATLVAGSLDAGLALLVGIAKLILVAAAWAALEVGGHSCASLALGAAVAVSGAGRACRALSGGSPANDRGSVHAARRAV